MSSGSLPSSAPTASELLAEPVIKAVLEQAWQDSLPEDPSQRHEEGGWIYKDLATGEFLIRRAAVVHQAGIDLSSPPEVAGATVVAKFHTHPHPASEGWKVGPSKSDQHYDSLHGVPDLIRAEDGVHFSGPPSRRGGLAGGPGFPP